MATDFKKLYEGVLRRGHLKVDDTTALPLVKEWVNDRYRRVARARPWRWLLKRGVIDLKALYSEGTVTTDGTAAIQGDSTSWDSSMAGRRFKTTDFDEVYEIEGVAGATELTLSTTYKGADGSSKGYLMAEPRYALASDFDRLLDPHRSFAPYRLEPIGIAEMNRRWGFHAQVGTPRHYTIVPDPETAETNLLLYPGPQEARTLYYDYFRSVTELSSDADEPLIPENYRDVLEIGAFADLLTYKDDERAAFWEGQFERRLAELAGDYLLTDDVPMFRPSDQYRSYYRSSRRGRVDDPWGFDHGMARR